MGRGWGWRVDTAGLEEMRFEDLFCYRFVLFFLKALVHLAEPPSAQQRGKRHKHKPSRQNVLAVKVMVKV